MKYCFFLMLAMLCLSTSVNAQNGPLGVWKSIDDKTGEAKSHVEVYQKNGKMYGKIIKILTDKPDAKCDDCKGSKKGQPVMGMVIIEGLQESEGAWKNGTILDPQNGNVYGCSVWVESEKPNELKVRGKHWTGIYRTQTWFRVK
ncbi:MAG TPA: DUF2147 domain-containing protein [Haliscomenobacter sp.]|uniref:DUF2147 domain-containing protein n=1 Tax=Haliscomenobacter sp. TaxID=2717303 RepID=UPI002CB5996D|nr:DUF2147 domain-containing protein [Haliscomenobacter sp.]HOY15823.1 DUF2147 domain-containing protein [Haliscomenobacter sp.]